MRSLLLLPLLLGFSVSAIAHNEAYGRNLIIQMMYLTILKILRSLIDRQIDPYTFYEDKVESRIMCLKIL
ncbi:hypothetical protein OA972_00285 [Prochlorococcus sp. AH-716-B03]|nr:hypothetical protein [Prochlorococcus sp. AH-716-B03]